jgi:hypothetical protein
MGWTSHGLLLPLAGLPMGWAGYGLGWPWTDLDMR